MNWAEMYVGRRSGVIGMLRSFSIDMTRSKHLRPTSVSGKSRNVGFEKSRTLRLSLHLNFPTDTKRPGCGRISEMAVSAHVATYS